LTSTDALDFYDQQPYALRIQQTQMRTQLPEAVLTGIGGRSERKKGQTAEEVQPR